MPLYSATITPSPANTTQNIITPTDDAVSALRLRQKSGTQSAALLTLETVAGSVISSFDASANILTVGNGAGVPVFTLNGLVGGNTLFQVAGVTKWQLGAVAGSLSVVDSANTRSLLVVTAGAAGAAFATFLDSVRIRAGAGQTEDPFQVLASDGTTKLAKINVTGEIESSRFFLSDGLSYWSTNYLVHYGLQLYLRSDTGKFSIGAADDVVLTRDAANTLALRNGANAQVFRCYGTFTDASNYERGSFDMGTAGQLRIVSEAAGTGTARDVAFRIAGANRWIMQTGGHLIAGGNNAYDVGTSAATGRPRTGYFGTSLISPLIDNPAATLQLGATTAITLSPTDGGLRINNQTNAAAAAAGTLLNSPVAGNPNFWLPISIAGVTRYIPCF